MKLQCYFKKFCYKSDFFEEIKKLVSSSQDNKLIYTVDVKLDQCDCPAGIGGQFCKHLCVVYKSGVNLITTPHLFFQDRIELANLAMGNNVNTSFL